MSNARIGQELGIALRTVENHLRAIYAKAGVMNRTHSRRCCCAEGGSGARRRREILFPVFLRSPLQRRRPRELLRAQFDATDLAGDGLGQAANCSRRMRW